MAAASSRARPVGRVISPNRTRAARPRFPADPIGRRSDRTVAGRPATLIAMEQFELADLQARQQAGGRPYLEFLSVPDLSIGLYVMPSGGVDRQQPHTEDEVYYVVSGVARVTVGDEISDVRAGSIVFVPATVPHRFHDIAEELTLLVVFGPAEGARAGKSA
jgi:mannose-6-phosphate isomerase-like protein (cupin superfamily)